MLILHKPNVLFMFPSDICTWVLSKFTLFYFCDINVPYGCGKKTDLGQFAFLYCKCGLHAKRDYLMYLLRGAERLYSVSVGKEVCETVGSFSITGLCPLNQLPWTTCRRVIVC